MKLTILIQISRNFNIFEHNLIKPNLLVVVRFTISALVFSGYDAFSGILLANPTTSATLRAWW
jgi:hypothetical protein